MIKRIIIFLFVLFFPSGLFAKDFIANGPIQARTQNPIYLQSIALMPTRAVALEEGRYSAWVNSSYSNIFDWGWKGPNESYLDMEIGRISLNAACGLGRNMDVSLEIPFLHFNGGYFDRPIQDFHSFFGFPNGGRSNVPNGQFVYRVTNNGRIVYNVGTEDFGLSDINIGFKHNFLVESLTLPGISWIFRFKFPTGKPSEGLGDGTINYLFGMALEKSISRWHFYLNLDYAVIPGNQSFGELYNNEVFGFMSAVELSVSQPISLIVQLQGSTPMLKGLGLSQWDGIPLDLVIGVKGTHKKLIFGQDFNWEWSFTEDAYPEGPSNDIGTMLVLGLTFGK